MSPVLGRPNSVAVKPEPGWKPILETAVAEVFALMAAIELQPLPENTGPQSGAITAMIGMAGALCGMINVRCSHTVAQKLAASMLQGSVAPQSGPASPGMIRDALGELCNMVAGNFKAKITNLADHCMLSVPTVITGEDYSIEAVDSMNLIRADFDFDGELIFVTLVVHT